MKYELVELNIEEIEVLEETESPAWAIGGGCGGKCFGLGCVGF